MRRHAVYRLAADLLLVFKPRGHREAEHAHPFGQRLRVLRGRLEVRTARRRLRLGPRAAALSLRAGRRHATVALLDTWLIAERLAGRARERASGRSRPVATDRGGPATPRRRRGRRPR